MEKDKQNDIYLLQCNLLDIQFKAELRKEETLFFLCALHRYLFQDVYPFAGQFRDIKPMKNGTFCQV
mgnify:CR=1 FL=1